MFLESGKLEKMFIKHTYTKKFGIYNGGLGVRMGLLLQGFLLVAIIAKTNRLK